MCGWLQPPTHDYDPPHLGYYIMFQLYPSKPNTHKGRYYSTWAVTWVTMQILVHTTPSLVFIYPDFHCPTTWYPHGQNPSYRFSIYHPIKTNNRLKRIAWPQSFSTTVSYQPFLNISFYMRLIVWMSPVCTPKPPEPIFSYLWTSKPNFPFMTTINVWSLRLLPLRSFRLILQIILIFYFRLESLLHHLLAH